jgi:hypothetical protein
MDDVGVLLTLVGDYVSRCDSFVVGTIIIDRLASGLRNQGVPERESGGAEVWRCWWKVGDGRRWEVGDGRWSGRVSLRRGRHQ